MDNEAQTIVSNVEAAFESYFTANNVDNIEDRHVREEIRDKCPVDNAIAIYFGNAASVARKKLKITHIIAECMYHLKLKVFGNKRLGKSSFIQLKRTIAQMKISPQLGVATWSKYFDTFQLYLPMCLWEASAKRGLYPEKYDEERCQEILEYALSLVYLTELSDMGWCLSEKSYGASITKLKEIEPSIIKQLKFAKQSAVHSKDIAGLQKQKGKSNDQSRSTERYTSSSGNGGGKTKRECKTCGKRHAGKCWKLQS